jgi:hypothetical protein
VASTTWRARSSCSGRAAHDVIELAPRQHREPAGHVDAPAARADAADVAHTLRQRHHLVVHAQALQRGVRIGNQPVAAHLVARESVRVDQHRVQAGTREQLRARAARGAGADDQHVA